MFLQACSFGRAPPPPASSSPPPEQQYDAESAETVALMMLGNNTVGKSVLREKYVNGSWKPNTPPVLLGSDFKAKQVVLGDKSVNLQLWIMADDTRGRTINGAMFQRAKGFMLVFDVGDMESFNALEPWAGDILFVNKGAKIAIVGNATGRLDDREVKTSDCKAMAKRLGGSYWEVDANDDDSVNAAFEGFVAELLGIVLRPPASDDNVIAPEEPSACVVL